jgi:5'-3' exonuclease
MLLQCVVRPAAARQRCHHLRRQLSNRTRWARRSRLAPAGSIELKSKQHSALHSPTRPGECLLIDGHPLVYAATYGTKHDAITRPSDGRHVAGMHQFGRSLIKLLRKFNPSSVAVFFDSPRKNFRHFVSSTADGGNTPAHARMRQPRAPSSQYKANRKKTPSIIREQLALSQVL